MGFPAVPDSPSLVAWLVFLLIAGSGVAAALHALLYKRHSRAAFGWMVTALFVPIAGPAAYAFFGVNRVGRRAQQYARERAPVTDAPDDLPADDDDALPVDDRYALLDRISASVTSRPLTRGNQVRCLEDGDEAYPAMLEAIRCATSTVWLASYIFDSDKTGQAFVDALADATRRGLDVRVLLDGVGEWYGRPRIGGVLDRAGVPFARFLPPRLIPPSVHVNLRNHRKILVVDGERAFAGGMNIGDRHVLAGRETTGHRDLHFELVGPVVDQLSRVFATDWLFATGDAIVCPPRASAGAGEARARAIVDGPDVDLDKLLLVLLGSFSAARESIRILTPYFVPPREMLAALHAAALRGVKVEIVIPENCNLPFVRWATHHLAWEPLKRGVHIYERPGAFAHTKLILIDDHYVQIGSANLDDRSLRLNFELMVEIYEPAFAASMGDYFERERRASRELRIEDVDSRSLPVRLRDGLFWLMSPYL